MASFSVFEVTEDEWTSEKFIDVLGLKMPALFTPDPLLLCDFITNFRTRPSSETQGLLAGTMPYFRAKVYFKS